MEDALEEFQFVVSTAAEQQNWDDTGLLLFAALATVAVSNFELVLNGPTLARIMNGDIRTWMHDDIKALNPQGIHDGLAGGILNDSRRIEILQGPTCLSPFFKAAMAHYLPGYTGRAIRDAPSYTTEEGLQQV